MLKISYIVKRLFRAKSRCSFLEYENFGKYLRRNGLLIIICLGIKSTNFRIILIGITIPKMYVCHFRIRMETHGYFDRMSMSKIIVINEN